MGRGHGIGFDRVRRGSAHREHELADSGAFPRSTFEAPFAGRRVAELVGSTVRKMPLPNSRRGADVEQTLFFSLHSMAANHHFLNSRCRATDRPGLSRAAVGQSGTAVGAALGAVGLSLLVTGDIAESRAQLDRR
jgi:hypothetical protein